MIKFKYEKNRVFIKKKTYKYKHKFISPQKMFKQNVLVFDGQI